MKYDKNNIKRYIMDKEGIIIDTHSGTIKLEQYYINVHTSDGISYMRFDEIEDTSNNILELVRPGDIIHDRDDMAGFLRSVKSVESYSDRGLNGITINNLVNVVKTSDNNVISILKLWRGVYIEHFVDMWVSDKPSPKKQEVIITGDFKYGIFDERIEAMAFGDGVVQLDAWDTLEYDQSSYEFGNQLDLKEYIKTLQYDKYFSLSEVDRIAYKKEDQYDIRGIAIWRENVKTGEMGILSMFLTDEPISNNKTIDKFINRNLDKVKLIEKSSREVYMDLFGEYGESEDDLRGMYKSTSTR